MDLPCPWAGHLVRDGLVPCRHAQGHTQLGKPETTITAELSADSLAAEVCLLLGDRL